MSNTKTTFTELYKELNLNRIQKKELYKQIGNRSIPSNEAKQIREEFQKINKNNIKEEIYIMSTDLNLIYYGPAGTGKTREALQKVEELTGANYDKKLFDENKEKLKDLQEKFEEAKGKAATALQKQIKSMEETIDKQEEEKKTFSEFTTFHPSYQYQEFIEGISIKEVKGNTSYEVKHGIFKKIAKRALENLDKNYVLIIDEINRGNISSIFGEFFTLLEDTKRSSSSEEENEEAVSITLPYSQEKLLVPDNLYIIGTMNTTDKSISLLDVALRRRFKFIAVEPQYDILKNIEDLSLSSMLKFLNKRLTILKGEDFQIGHSYFLNSSTIEDLQETFEYKIIPLLKEYFHSDWESICAVLNQDYQAIGDSGLLINKFEIENNLFKENSKFSKMLTKKKTLKLNNSFTINDLKSIYQ